MAEQECKSDLEQLTNDFFFRFWGVLGFRTNLPRRRSKEYLFKGKYEVCFKFTRVWVYLYNSEVGQISRETSKLDAAPPDGVGL